MKTYFSHFRAPLFLLVLMTVSPSLSAQTVSVKGTAYLDYYYNFSDEADASAEGENGFTYRRMYLTTDFGISDKLSARFRLEANASSTTAQGRPAPFVKDLYFRWKNIFAEGHDLYVGISSPPAFTVSESVWGYRSLEKTILDRVKVVASRDFGVALRGRLTESGTVRYGVMFANNSGVNGETDKYKRGYAQLEFYPTKELVATIGGNYAGMQAGGSSVNLNGFVGYDGSPFAIGLEGFYLTKDEGDVVPSAAKSADILSAILSSDEDRYGFSSFARYRIDKKVELVGRYDYSTYTDIDVSESYFVGGVSVNVHDTIQIIPNVVVNTADDASESHSAVTGRITLHANF